MRYPVFGKQKLFVGSGVIDAACRTVIAQRLKLSGIVNSGRIPFMPPSPNPSASNP
jgi:hypothetical protein